MVEWKPIDELFNFEKGSLQSSKCTPGKYTFITAAEEWKTHSSYTHDCEALIFAMAASGSLGRTHYIKGKFISSDLCFILTPKKGMRLDLTFYHRLFNFLRSDIVKKTATGTSKLAINQTNFGAYRLPYFDYDHQLIFRDKIEKINSISESYSQGLEEQLSLFKKLRQAILQEAIEGKLTADWRKKHPELISGENHASKLLEKIKAEKEQLIKEGKIKKEKPIAPIKDAEKPFDLPEGWVWCRFGNICEISTNNVSPFDYQNHPHIAPDNIEKCTGKLLEYKTVKEDNVISVNHLFYPGMIVYSKVRPRLRKVTEVDFEGLCSADMYPLTPKINKRYLKTVMLTNFFDSEVYKFDNRVKMPKINQDQLNTIPIPIPSLAEQKAIVERVDKLMAMIDELEKQVNERKDKSERLMQSVLREAFMQ